MLPLLSAVKVTTGARWPCPLHAVLFYKKKREVKTQFSIFIRLTKKTSSHEHTNVFHLLTVLLYSYINNSGREYIYLDLQILHSL